MRLRIGVFRDLSFGVIIRVEAKYDQWRKGHVMSEIDVVVVAR